MEIEHLRIMALNLFRFFFTLIYRLEGEFEYSFNVWEMRFECHHCAVVCVYLTLCAQIEVADVVWVLDSVAEKYIELL